MTSTSHSTHGDSTLVLSLSSSLLPLSVASPIIHLRERWHGPQQLRPYLRHLHPPPPMDHPDLVLFGKHSSENANGPQLNDATEVLCGLCHRCSPIAMPRRLLPRMHMRLPPDRKRRHGCSLPTLQLPERGHSEQRGLGRGIKVGRWKFLRHINVDRFQSNTKLEALMQVCTRA
jgi:hypothetical protein